MRCIRHQDLFSFIITARFMIGLYHRHTGKLTLGTCHRREGGSGHTGHFAQHRLQLIHAGKETLVLRVGG